MAKVDPVVVTLPTPLWERLRDYPIDDPGVEFPFSKRFARENGWSSDYTARVILEYKRFLYLCAGAGHPVTPSDEVDQAWHLHLCYTRSYWDEVCGGIIGRPIHHGPTRGGKSEGEKFGAWYARTLESYAVHFGHAPPPDIWPASRVRFDARRDFRRIDVSRFHLLPRSAKWKAAAVAGALALCGCTLFEGREDVGSVLFFLLLGLIILKVIHNAFTGGGGGGGSGGGRRRGSRRGGGTSGCGGCSTSSGCGKSDNSGCGSSGCGSGCGGGCGGD